MQLEKIRNGIIYGSTNLKLSTSEGARPIEPDAATLLVKEHIVIAMTMIQQHRCIQARAQRENTSENSSLDYKYCALVHNTLGEILFSFTNVQIV